MHLLSHILHYSHVIPLISIVLGAYISIRFVMLFIGRVVKRTLSKSHYASAKERKQREDTIIIIVRTALRVLIWTIAGLMLLSEFGIDVAPLLAGAGVLGVALGFGAQSMVRDFLAGMFIIAENQYRVGDVVQINKNIAGVVEHLSLRATVMRDLSGVVHYVPNGNIQFATNMTMGYAQVDLDVSVGYSTDIDKLERVINEVGQQIYADEKWHGVALEPARMFRVENFAESAIIVKVVCKTAPIRQWEVKSEILRRLKVAFEHEGIEIPFPQRVIHEAPAK